MYKKILQKQKQIITFHYHYQQVQKLVERQFDCPFSLFLGLIGDRVFLLNVTFTLAQSLFRYLLNSFEARIFQHNCLYCQSQSHFLSMAQIFSQLNFHLRSRHQFHPDFGQHHGLEGLYLESLSFQGFQRGLELEKMKEI